MIIVGIDPDSSKHGVSVYENGVITFLESIDLMNFIDLIKDLKTDHAIIEAHVEDVCAVSNSCFHWKPKDTKYVKAKKSESIGLCKQSQIELERALSFYGIEVTHHKISKMWKKDKAQFEKITGWTGRSNEDTRSAAYFGWLGVTNNRKLNG